MSYFLYLPTRAILLIAIIFVKHAVQEEILEHPQTQYSLVGDVAVFHCIARGQLAYWLIDNQAITDSRPDVRERFEERGFRFSFVEYFYESDQRFNLTVTVEASEVTNNSLIECRALGRDYNLYVESRKAYLHVFLDFRPYSPTINLADGWCSPSTLFSFSLSIVAQPLWPEYNISELKINTTDGHSGAVLREKSVIPHRNGTGDYFYFRLNETASINDVQQCSSLILISVAAVNDDYGESMASTVQMDLSRALEIMDHAIEYEVLYYRNGTPLLTVEIKFPNNICPCQQIVYTIELEDTSLGVNQTAGPYNHTGPGGCFQHTITDILESDRNYSMSVTMESAGEHLESASYLFDTFWKPIPVSCSSSEGHLFKIGTWSSVAILVVASISCCILLVCVLTYPSNKYNRPCLARLSKPKRDNLMVKNPVYECPVYESIQPTLDTLVLDAQQAMSSSSVTTNGALSGGSDTMLPNVIVSQVCTQDQGQCLQRNNRAQGTAAILRSDQGNTQDTTVNGNAPISISGKQMSVNSTLQSTNRNILSKNYSQ